MGVEHLPRNATIPIPVDVPLFDGTSPLTGEAAFMVLKVINLESGYTLDTVDGLFRLNPVTPNMSLVAYTNYAFDYGALVAQSSWPRGHYRGQVHHSITGQYWDFDFTIGLFVTRALGYSAVYDGSTLDLSVWVEENGEAQTDYIKLSNCKMLDAQGNVLADGTWPDNTSPNNGVFNFIRAVSLAPVTNYLFACTASVAGPAGRPNYTFNLRIGLARP